VAQGTCSIEGCSNRAYARTWCSKHYQRWLKHGSPDWEPPQRWVGELNPAWTGDRATYDGMHQRVKTKYGRPSEHACVDCGAPATDWSLQHDVDPSTLRSETVNGWLLWYSLDVDGYAPRCHRCHGAYDWNRRMATRPRRRGERGRFLPYLDDD